MNDADMVLVTYKSPNMGQHKVVGQATKIFYGYRGGGEQFLVHRRDIELVPGLFEPVSVKETVVEPAPRTETPPPVAVEEKQLTVAEDDPIFSKKAEEPVDQWGPEPVFDLQTLPGVSGEIAQEMNASGIFTPDDIIKLGLTKLQAFKGVGKARARSIFEGAKRSVESQDEEKHDS